MKWINYSVKEYLLLFFVLFFVVDSYGQTKFSYARQWAHLKKYIGSEQTGTDAILESRNFNLKHIPIGTALPDDDDNTTSRHIRTEGSIYATYTKDLLWYESKSEGAWNRIGIINTGTTKTTLYRVNSSGIMGVRINGDFTHENNWSADPNIYLNESVIELGSTKVDGCAILVDLGPGVSKKNLYTAHQWGNDGGRQKWYKKQVEVSTSKLIAPKNVKLTESLVGKTRYITLNYDKGTLYPNSMAAFRVYYRLKGSKSAPTSVGTFTNTTARFNLPANLQEGEYEFFVQSDLDTTALKNFGLEKVNIDNYSEPMVVADQTVAVVNFDFIASTDKAAKISVNWSSVTKKNISQVGGIELFKDDISIGVYSKNQSSYDDTDVVPGMWYKYRIQVLDENYNNLNIPGVLSAIEKEGSSLNNGKISGTVKTATGAALSGVEITLINKDLLYRNESNTGNSIKPNTVLGTATTDNTGFYTFSDIFYNKKADFIVKAKVPWAETPRLEADSMVKTLDLQENIVRDVNFVDTASFAVTGYVYYPEVGGDDKIKLPVAGAKIFIDGQESGVRTDNNGYYNQAFPKAGNYRLQVKVDQHTIVPEANYNNNILDSVQSIRIDRNIKMNNFVDKTTKPAYISLEAYGGAPIGEFGTLSITSVSEVAKELQTAGASKLDHVLGDIYAKDTTFTKIYNAQSGTIAFQQVAPGQIKVNLPPIDFSLKVTDVRGKIGVQGSQVTSIQRDAAKMEFFNSASNGVKNLSLSVQDSAFIRDGDDLVPVPIDKSLYFTYFEKVKVVIDTLTDSPKESNSVFPVEYLKRVQNFNKEYNVAEQNDQIGVRFKLYHLYSYDGQTYNMPLDTGKITITDAIGDVKDAIVHTLRGEQSFDYRMNIGAPRIEEPWVKYITVIGELASLDPDIYRDSVIVLGERARLGTFYSRGPERTHFVLHDPPGDNSNATLQKGTTFSWSENFNQTFGGGAGIATDTKLGFGWGNMFNLQKSGAGLHIQANVISGKNNDNDISKEYTLTLEETFSTSADPNFVGEDGDVFIGSSTNSTYNLTDVLAMEDLGANIVNIVPDTMLVVDNIGFSTTFVYTQYHIKNVLLPQLETLLSIANNDLPKERATFNSVLTASKVQHDNDSAKIVNDPVYQNAFKRLSELEKDLHYYTSSIKAWKEAIEQNQKNRERAKGRIVTLSAKGNGTNDVFIPGGIVGKNISFSAGSSYDNLVQIDSTESKSYADEIFFNSDFFIGYFAKVDADFNESSLGATVTANYTETKTTVSGTSTSNIVSFHLEDDDPGDYFSVDIGSDPYYGTPVFTTVAGASSCPPEDGTQRRFIALIENEGTAVSNNVPATESAKFKIRITNRSESDEEGTYGIRLVSTSNLNGAKVLVGGQDVTTHEALYTIPTGKSFVVPVEVIKGPIDNEYEDLVLVMYPSCEQTLSESEKIGDYSESDTRSFAKISATFQPNCSEVDLFLPGDDWLINQNHNDQLNVVFSKYDASQTSPLEYVQLEYRRLNTGGTAGEWQKIGEPVYKSALDQPQKQLVFNINKLLDGNYQLRAYASCTNGVNYSPVYTGKIDRKSAVLFGLPTPANGILTRQDIVSIDYNKAIRNDANNPIKTSLVNTASGENIPAKVVVNGKQIQILSLDPTHLDRLENQELEASIWNVIDDQSGNLVQDTITWRFVVSRSNLYWSPNTATINVEEGSTGLFTALIKNKTASSQDFSLSKFPTYITPTMRNGKVSPQGEVKVDFSISNALNTGTYVDTLHVVNDRKEQFFYLTVNVLKKAPNWQVDKSKYKYSMNIVSQFSLDDNDNPLSEDTFDKVAAFVGNEVRGVAHIEYDANMDKYYAFVTAYTNDLKEKLSFRFWDARPGIEYVAKESESFVNGGVLGVANTLFILHPKEVVQTIPLAKGWNWVSLYLENADMTLQNVLSSLKPTSGTQVSSVTSAGDMSEYNSQVGWAGTLKNIELYNAYRIYVDQADTLVWTGQFAKEARVLPLNEGWNALGYPMPFNIALNSYLEGIPFDDGTRIMSQDEFAVYNAATQKWIGSLKYLRPNNGYRLAAASDASAFGYNTYTAYQITGNTLKADMMANQLPRPRKTISGSLDGNKSIELTAYDGSVNTIYALNIGGENVNAANANNKVAKAKNTARNYEKLASTGAPVFKSNTTLAAITDRFEIMSYVDDELIGISTLQRLDNGEIRGFMSSGLSDNLQGKKLRYVIYDALEDKSYDAIVKEQMTASDGARHGSIDRPLVLAIEGDADLELSSDIAAKTITLGESVLYEILVSNSGEATAVQVAVHELIPAGFEIMQVESSTGHIEVKDGQWAYSTININKGSTDRIKVQLKATRVGVYSLGNVEVQSNNDTNPSNNTLYGKEIEVIDARSNASNIFVPSFISPNGDGINDRFEIVGLGEFIKGVSLIIYDKSSNVIYRSNDYQNEWDGGNAPLGAYGYNIKGTDRQGKIVEFKGYVSIVR